MSQTTFGLTVTAAGEIRDADGNLKETVEMEETVEVDLETLRSFSDEQLRAAGLDGHTITQIRGGIA